MMATATFLAVSVFSQTTFAVELKDIPPAPQDRLPIDVSEPSIPCDQIIDRLLKYNQMARENDGAIAGFLGEVTTKITEWYDILSPLEGTQQKLKPGAFAPLQKGAEQISNVTNLAFDNSDLLAQELDKIILSLQSCGLEAPAPAAGLPVPHK